MNEKEIKMNEPSNVPIEVLRTLGVGAIHEETIFDPDESGMYQMPQTD